MTMLQVVRGRGFAVQVYRAVVRKPFYSTSLSPANLGVGMAVKKWQIPVLAVENIDNRSYSTTKVATEGSPPTESALGIDEYESIMNPSILPSPECMLVTDEHFDDVADGAELVAESGHDIGHRELRFMSATMSTSSASTCEAVSRYDYDYDEYQLHMSPLQATKVDHEHLSSLDMIGHEDVFDVKEQRMAWGRTEESDGGNSDWEVHNPKEKPRHVGAEDHDTVIDW